MYPATGLVGVNSRIALLIAVPVIVAAVIVLTVLGVFSSPVILAVIVVLWVVVSYSNRRRFGRQKEKGTEKSGTS